MNNERKELYKKLGKFQEKDIIIGKNDVIKCPVCEISIKKILYNLNDFRVLECEKCKFKIRDKIPNDKSLKEFYNLPDYWKTPYFFNCFKEYDENKPEIQIYLRVLDLLKKEKGLGKLLDIGCATGVFLNLAKKRGYLVEGLEISKYAAEYGMKHFSLNIKNSILEDANYPINSFDIITAFEVIEHIKDVESFVRICHRILKKDGWFVLMTPDHSSFIAWFAHLLYILSFKKYKVPIYGIYDIEHIAYFSQETLKKLTENNGFKQIYLLKESLDLEKSKEVQERFYKIGMQILIYLARIFNKQFKIIGIYKKKAS